MTKQRFISTSFWDDPWVHRLDPSEKLMYLYLMTNPLTNIAGIYKISIERMVYDTGFNENTVRHILEKFEKSGKAILFGEYIVIPSWPKHQRIKTSPKIKAGVDSILKEIPLDVLIIAKEKKYAYPIDTLLKGYGYSSNYSDSDSDSDSDSSPKPPMSGRSRFQPPTLDEVAAYCHERGNAVDAKAFVGHYTANGWRIGKSPMADWRAAVQNWEGQTGLVLTEADDAWRMEDPLRSHA